MDWSDTALDANHRVMVQMRSMPHQLRSWDVKPSPMDAWLDARMTQRAHEFCTAMDEYDLRRAVEISHYDIIKDINWYTRRGGENLEVARRWLPLWAQMVSVSTPHLAEEWWADLESNSTFVSGSTMNLPAPLTDEQTLVLSAEQYVRDVLEQARKVRVVAERHLGTPASHATFVVAPSWKRTMAQAALTFLQDGGHPKKFIPLLQEMPLAQGERKGEMIGFWGKKMLPQVFKWDDASKAVIASTMDEHVVLDAAGAFIAAELDLETVVVIVGESDQDETGRAGSAMPLSPAVVYS
jgi:leucyl-tRNA synthetase